MMQKKRGNRDTPYNDVVWLNAFTKSNIFLKQGQKAHYSTIYTPEDNIIWLDVFTRLNVFLKKCQKQIYQGTNAITTFSRQSQKQATATTMTTRPEITTPTTATTKTNQSQVSHTPKPLKSARRRVSFADCMNQIFKDMEDTFTPS